MKNLAKRGVSMLLALCLCLGLFSGIVLPEAQAASYTYNWGQRGTVADELSDAAIAWYEKYNITYSELSQLSGASSTSSVPSSALYNELADIMTTAHSYKNGYDANKTLCAYTDCQNGGGVISSFYSGKSIGPDWDGTWNREHTWPNSKGLGGSDENDIMMIRPTATSENGARGNTAYGEGSSYYDPNDESGGTYNLHGDCARIVLYVYTRWGNTSYMWGTSGVMESKEILLKWMEEDPVDTWELGRNDAVQSITGTRNVFVDYPELAFLMFDEEVPAGYTSPSGEGASANYNITAYSNNSTYGTVSLSGKTITATPKTGYYVSGYTVTSGTATVTQSGNTFKVSAESDCSIMINFAAKTAVTLTFMENGVTGSTMASYGGDSVTLPSNTNTVADGYTFVGWTDSTVSDTTTKPTLYTAGTSVTASDKTYYAVYSYSVGGTGVTEYVLKDITEITADDVFVITSATSSTVYALPNDAVSKGPTAVTVTASGDKLASEPASNLLWNLGGTTDAWEFYPDGDTSRWLASSDDNNGMSVGTGSNKAYKINSGYLYNNGVSRYVGVYVNNPDWRCYTSSSGNIANQTLGFYVKSESGTVYYSTSTFVCDHADTTNTAAVSATCTESGYTAGVYCNDCETYISGHEVVAALDHSWGDWVQTTAPTCTDEGVETATCSRCGETKTQAVASEGHDYEGVVTAPTVTEQGYTTYTCLTCGDSYVSDYTEALGETFIVSFSVPADVTAVADMECGKNGITLPTAEAPEGYSFLGWTTAAVEDTETKPQILTGTYNAVANTTLYALYSYVEIEEGQATNVYTLYSGAFTEGEYVVVYNGSAMVAADANDNTRLDSATVTITDDTITAPDSSVVWNIVATDDGYYTIYNESAGVYAAGLTSNNKATLLTAVTTYAKWTVSGDSTYEFQNAGNSRYMHLNGTTGWGCYSSSTGGAVSLYKGVSGTTYYTTLTTQAAPVAAVYENDQQIGTYATFAEAYAACADGQHIRLLADVGSSDAPATLDMDKDLYVDLNNWYLYATVTANDYRIYGMDRATDRYDGEEFGAMEVSGANVASHTDGYLAYSWGTVDGVETWSFHAYSLELTYITLKPHVTGIGYKAVFMGDEYAIAALDQTEAFGYTLSLEGGLTVNRYLAAEKLVSSKPVTLRVDNYDVVNFAGNALSVQVSVKLANGEVIAADAYTTTFKDVVEAVNAQADTLSDEQKTAVREMISSHAIMQSWNVGNLWTEES